MEPWYTTREAVKAATDMATTARRNAAVDRAIEAASRAIELKMHRRFYPELATRTFDWPPSLTSRSWRLWLDEHELVSASAVVSGGIALTTGQYILRPDAGPPFDRIEIRLDGSGAWSSGSTHQRAISITGVFGYCNTTTGAGALAEDLDASETTVDVTDSAAVGVGDLVLVDAERMQVTDKRMVATGQTLQAPMQAQKNAESVAVTTGSAFAPGEMILLDAERMLVVDVAGNSLIVERAYDGSTLAAHTGSTIYAPRTLVVERGVLGTTAATHSTAAAVRRHVPPGPISSLALAIAVSELQQQLAGYARVSGSGDNARETAGKGLAQAWKDADGYRRRARGGAV